MGPLVSPTPRLVLAVLLLLFLAAAGALALFGRTLALPVLMLAVGGGALAVAVVLLRRAARDADAVAAWIDGLADGAEGEAPVDGTGVVRSIAAPVARLHRTLAERCAQAQLQLDANVAILDALHDPLILVGAGRRVERANAAARGLFGERMVDRDLATALRAPAVLEAVDAVLAGAASRTVEFSLPVPVERQFELRVKPFQRQAHPSPGGRIAILTLHDITALRRSEQMRADFVANASHELRTPLSSLIGFIETLRGPARDDTEARDRFLGIMHDQASRMSRLVQDLLSLSRIELDEHMPPSDRVDVVERVQSVLDAFELKAQARAIHLRLVAPDRVPEVVGDADQLTQVFQNLVGNAIKYARSDSEVTVTVAVTDGAAVGGGAALASVAGRRPARPSSRLVSVAVTDHGEGIARTHLPRLTERFYRVDAARSRAMGGTGLGLAIVKHILNRHRARLTIESEVGVGSTFTAYLPAAADEAAAGGDGTASRPAAAPVATMRRAGGAG
ncbi:ATP-binding protein [Azospirillum halopraeferens]|uniref:ATP-binding protein n=1 Tax=Azospirillum halopraeferens TaxID=34010 RepID=UPI000416A09F|nr:ATP-binding protein [Azospirillum halopraeferens]